MLPPALTAFCRRLPRRATLLLALVVMSPLHAGEAQIRYFPAGMIYEYRWKLLQLALQHTRTRDGEFQLQPVSEDITQNRGMQMLQAGEIEVVALGTNVEREAAMLPVRIDILRGIVGYRLLVIRAADQPRIAGMDEPTLRRQLVFGLNSQWADLPIMRAAGLNVETTAGYDNLFAMLAVGRFDAFPRGLNEAPRELQQQRQRYPQLAIERSKALYFPYPVYFWVNKSNPALAARIERGLKLALADGSFQRLFTSYHADEIALLRRQPRQVIRLDNPVLPPGNAAPDTSWWWDQQARQ